MQDRYAGDVGDFGKYGLLRALTAVRHGDERLRLGIAWYLVPDELQNDDGKHVSYLSAAKEGDYRPCDPDLFDRLREIVGSGQRTVASVQHWSVLPPDTLFHSARLSFAGIPRDGRESERAAWVEQALEATAACDMVFVDPDNGLEVPSTRRDDPKGPKYVYLDELARFRRRRQSLIVYHHLNRLTKHADQIVDRMGWLEANLGPGFGILAMHYHRGTARVYFVIPATEGHRHSFTRRIEAMIAGSWGAHFELVASGS